MAAPIPSRLALQNCSEGRHVPGPVSGGIEYAGAYSGGRQHCTICGATRTVSGGKTYESPYWKTHYGEWRR